MDSSAQSLGGALIFDQVTRRFGRRDAVSGFSLTLQPGEVVCLLGGSGCGKTTTLRLAAGLERCDSGRILIDRTIVDDTRTYLPPERRGVGLMFQDFALFPHLKVIENVAFGLRGLASSERTRRAEEMIERVGMSRFAQCYPHRLSGGEQQRIALARALAPNPRILLMDEPFSDLDPLLRDRVRSETFRLLRRLGTSVLFVTHDPAEAMDVADRIALMRAGQLVQLGTPSEIFDRPVDRDAATFFGDVNVIHAFVRDDHAPTVFGDIPCGALSDGTEVEVLVRPHSIRVINDGAPGTPARVMSSRRAGCESIVDLEISPASLPPGAPALPLIRARIPELGGIEPGHTVSLAIDQAQALVFPCQNPAPQRASGMPRADDAPHAGGALHRP